MLCPSPARSSLMRVEWGNTSVDVTSQLCRTQNTPLLYTLTSSICVHGTRVADRPRQREGSESSRPRSPSWLKTPRRRSSREITSTTPLPLIITSTPSTHVAFNISTPSLVTASHCHSVTASQLLVGHASPPSHRPSYMELSVCLLCLHPSWVELSRVLAQLPLAAYQCAYLPPLTISG